MVTAPIAEVGAVTSQLTALEGARSGPARDSPPAEDRIEMRMLRPRHNARPVTAAVAVVAGGLTLAALWGAADVAVAGPFTPDAGGSPNADDIDTLYRIALYIGIVVFLIVEGTLIWSIWRYRRRRGGPAAAQIRGNAPLEIGWTVAAVAILVVLAVVTFSYLDDIRDPPGAGPGTLAGPTQLAAVDQRPGPLASRTLKIDVNGQQFLWRYDYPGTEPLYNFYEMVVPTDTTISLDITSSDVVHSWWIPVLGGKADAVPGHVNHTWFRISEEGVYRGVCAELCGYNHADMRAAVRAVSPTRFREWARRKRAQIRQAGEDLAAERRAREQGP